MTTATAPTTARQWRLLQTTARAWGLAWPRAVPLRAVRWAV